MRNRTLIFSLVCLVILSVVNPTRMSLFPAAFAQSFANTVRQPTGSVLEAERFPFLGDALAAAGTAPATIIVSRPLSIPVSLAVPPQVTLSFRQGGVINIAAGAVLSINGPIEAPNGPIFTGSGQVLFGTAVTEVHPQWFGAMGDGRTDDAPALNRAISSLKRSGGTIFLSKGTYRAGSTLTLFGNIRLTGQAATILGDFTGYSLIHAEGTYGKQVVITANIKAGDTSVRVAGTSGMARGDMIQIQDNRNGTRYAREIAFIKDVGADTITLTAPLAMPYRVAYQASANKISGLDTLEIDNLTLEGSAKSSLNYMIFIRNGHHLQLHHCLIRGHRFPAKPNLLISLYVSQSYDVKIDNITTQGVADVRLDAGDCIALFACGKGSVTNCRLHKCVFGIGAWMGTGYSIANNRVEGFHQSGRGIKLAGSYNSKIISNTIQATDSGIKHEDSGRNEIRGNTILSCGVASYSSGINVSNQHKSSEGDFARITIADNRVRNQTGNGIYADEQSRDTVIANNIVDQVTDRGIIALGDNSRITGNRVTESAGTGIVFNPDGATVASNYVRSSNSTVKSFRISSVNRPETCRFTDNSAPDNPWDMAVSPALLGVYRSNKIPGMPADR